MADRIPVNPELLLWAVERAGKRVDEVPGAAEWIAGSRQPTWRQLEEFAAAVRVPVGYLFLACPPEEPVPMTDFRRVGGTNGLSVNLLDTITMCLERQAWFEEYAERHGLAEVAWVGSMGLQEQPAEAADALRDRVRLPSIAGPGSRGEALRALRTAVEAAGGLVMASGIVGTSTRRRLAVDEFRGFSLASGSAPLIFLNTQDSLAGQIFTLVHELGHLLLGASALDDLAIVDNADEAERWCNRVASELLLPADEFRARTRGDSVDDVEALSRYFKVSTLVVMHRMRELGLLAQADFWPRYRAEEMRLAALPDRRAATGGDFIRTQLSRLGSRFPGALVSSAGVGETPYAEAYRLLGVRTTATYDKLAAQAKGAA